MSGEFRIPEMRISYDIASSPGSVSLSVGDGKSEKLPVIPDAWIVFERVRPGGKIAFPVLLEIDRGTMYKQRFKRHVRSRIEFVRSGGYSGMFGIKAVMIVYATTGERVEYKDSRRRALCEWTMEVLGELKLPWAELFRFYGLSFRVYESTPFGKAVWFRPDQESPVDLFGG